MAKRNNNKNNKRNDSSKSGRNNGRRNGRDQRDEDIAKKDAIPDRSTNHIGWYVPDPNLLANVGNIPFGYRLGDNLPVYGDHNLPGIVALRYVPTYGELTDSTSPANVADLLTYQFTRHANSGSKVYDAVDQGIMIMSMDSIFSAVQWVQRALSIATLFSSKNRYLPSALLQSMGIDAEDLVSNTNSYITQLNYIILKLDTLWIPNNYPVFERHAWMCSKLFWDEDNEKGQVYFYSPRQLYKFDLSIEDGSGKLVPFNWNRGEVHTLQHYIDLINDMLDPVYGDEDVGVMCGDILKAYGKENCYSFSTLAQRLTIAIEYDTEALEQIHNADVMNIAVGNIEQVIVEHSAGTSAWLAQDIHVEDVGDELTKYYNSNRLFDLHHEPNPENVMRASRLKIGMLKPVEGVTGKYTLTSMGTEVITNVTIYTRDTTSENGYRTTSYTGPKVETTYEADAMLQLIADAYNISYFPMLTCYNAYEERVNHFGNTDNVTIIAPSNIEGLHNVAVLGEFGLHAHK